MHLLQHAEHVLLPTDPPSPPALSSPADYVQRYAKPDDLLRRHTAKSSSEDEDMEEDGAGSSDGFLSSSEPEED